MRESVCKPRNPSAEEKKASFVFAKNRQRLVHFPATFFHFRQRTFISGNVRSFPATFVHYPATFVHFPVSSDSLVNNFDPLVIIT